MSLYYLIKLKINSIIRIVYLGGGGVSDGKLLGPSEIYEKIQ